MYGLAFLITFMSIATVSLSQCRYRNRGNLPPEIFAYWSNWGCYTYTRPDLFAGQQLQASICLETRENVTYEIPGLIREEKCIPFFYQNNIVKISVERTFESSDTVQRWIRCCLDAETCCKKVMMSSLENDDHCPSLWDGWSCFNQIPSGQVYYQVCSQYAYSRQPPHCHHYSSKTCHANATWEDQTDYSGCDITPRLISRTLWHISTLVVSIIVCIPAIFVLAFYHNLHTEKLILIRTILIAIVIRNFITLIVKGTLIMDELTSTSGSTIMSENEWPCKTLSVFEKLTGTGVFACMLLEGIYLHQVLTKVFRARLKGSVRLVELYIGSFVVTLSVSLAWALAMELNDKQHCWQVTEGTAFHWIFDGPRLIMLVLNFGLLLHIVWALWWTFRNRQEEHHPAIRTAKAALICLPLFGVPFFFLIVRPDTTDCSLEQSYYIFYYSVDAIQGILIAILHCYTEREVKAKFSCIYRYVKRKLSKFYVRNLADRRRRPTAGSSFSRTSSQSRRESDISAGTLATPQVEYSRERFSLPLPRIQEIEERKINDDLSSTSRIYRHRLSVANLSTTSMIYVKINPESLHRRHSADETEVDRTEEFIQFEEE